MKRCTRCILAEDFPNIKFDSNGVCNYCHQWDKEWQYFDYEKSEAELMKILNSAKKKRRKYDCLIPYSGGRDSSYVVYLCKEKYDLNPMLVTFNNLFMSEHAIKNINSMVEIMDVEHCFVTYKPKVLKRFYRAAIERGGEFCSICAAGINYAKIVYQKLYNIPIVITGTSGRVDEQSPFEVNCTHPLYVRRLLSSAGFSKKEINDYVIERHFEWGLFEKIKRKINRNDYVEVALPNYVNWNNQEIERILVQELKWTTSDDARDHIDCRFVSVKNYLKNKQIPNFIFKQEKYSQLIRDNQLTRDEALEALNKLLKVESREPDEIDEFLDFLGLVKDDTENQERKSHLNFINKEEVEVHESLSLRLASIPWKIYKVLRM
ncbi:MAG: N-acetyl sugar amidotransferase [Bacteroidales bacterium]|nr:N-acetyl sugar amidotransferase [Bacteroidales bacterium]